VSRRYVVMEPDRTAVVLAGAGARRLKKILEPAYAFLAMGFCGVEDS
jgi:hypothetical protein